MFGVERRETSAADELLVDPPQNDVRRFEHLRGTGAAEHTSIDRFLPGKNIDDTERQTARKRFAATQSARSPDVHIGGSEVRNDVCCKRDDTEVVRKHARRMSVEVSIASRKDDELQVASGDRELPNGVDMSVGAKS